MPVPDTDCRIVDLDDWTKEMGPGEEGELAISGPQVMRGYFNRPEETECMIKTDQEGRQWLLTGDIAKMDEEGYFFIVDRKKDMILVSGFNVYPTDIEQVLYRHPKIQKVAVAGVPDQTTGEAVKAYVVLKDGETSDRDEIISFARENLTGYRVPKLVEFRNSLPESLVGKVLRRKLQEEERSKADSGS
jgi:long-chain acyl-CoA synthetase